MKNDERWMANYKALKTYIEDHGHLPDKHKIESRGSFRGRNTKKERSKKEASMNGNMRCLKHYSLLARMSILEGEERNE